MHYKVPADQKLSVSGGGVVAHVILVGFDYVGLKIGMWSKGTGLGPPVPICQ